MELTPLSTPNPGKRRPSAALYGLDNKLVEKLSEEAEPTPRQRKYESWRKTTYYFLERPENKVAIIYHLVNLLLIVGSIITSILSTIQSYEDNDTLRDLIFY